MPLIDAMKVALSENNQGRVRIYLQPIEKEVTLRCGTTDLLCFYKVFIADEYRLPFAVSPRLIIDAGANVGMATLFFAWQYPRAHIVAIEPEQRNFEVLRQNCEGLNNVTLINAALWSESRELAIANPNAEECSFSVTDQFQNNSPSPSVCGITIKQILDRMRADQIDILKLDIEGSELELFSKNAGDWLECVGLIVIELHDRLVPGCACAFYSALNCRRFVQEIRGENIFVQLRPVT
jgi:FkbM family methyltransferase